MLVLSRMSFNYVRLPPFRFLLLRTNALSPAELRMQPDLEQELGSFFLQCQLYALVLTALSSNGTILGGGVSGGNC